MCTQKPEVIHLCVYSQSEAIPFYVYSHPGVIHLCVGYSKTRDKTLIYVLTIRGHTLVCVLKNQRLYTCLQVYSQPEVMLLLVYSQQEVILLSMYSQSEVIHLCSTLVCVLTTRGNTLECVITTRVSTVLILHCSISWSKSQLPLPKDENLQTFEEPFFWLSYSPIKVRRLNSDQSFGPHTCSPGLWLHLVH